MIKFIPIVMTSILLLSALASAQDILDNKSPEETFRELRELRARIEDAHRRRMEIKPTPTSELRSMSEEEANAVVLRESKASSELRRIQSDAFEEAEDLVTSLISQLLTRGTLDQVISRNPSNDMLKWVDGNAAYTNEEREEIKRAVHTDLSFFAAAFQDYPVGQGKTLYVFEIFGATSNPLAEGTGRAWPTSAFLVRKTSEEVVLHSLEGEQSNSWYSAKALYGATPTPDSEWPFLVLVKGPEGTAHMVHVSRLDIDEGLDMVRSALVGEAGNFLDYRFDPDSGTLHYPASLGWSDENDERAFKAGEVEPGIPQEYSKGIHFPIPGAAQRDNTAPENDEVAEAGAAPPARPDPDARVQRAINQREDTGGDAASGPDTTGAPKTGGEAASATAPAQETSGKSPPVKPAGGNPVRWTALGLGLAILAGAALFLITRKWAT